MPLFLLALTFWLLNHPYQGIWHDALVYGLLAAHWQTPNALSNDLFFAFGSQGDLSAFTPIYGKLVEVLGLDRAAWLTVFVGASLWVAATMTLAYATLGNRFAGRFAVLLWAIITVSYAPEGIVFQLNENFATARSIAFPVGLTAAAALFFNRNAPPTAAFCLALATLAIHPLLGIWPFALVITSRMTFRGAVILAASPILIALIIGLADLSVPPFRLMTGEWLRFSLEEAPSLVLRTIDESNLPTYLTTLAMLGAGTIAGRRSSRPIYARMLLLAFSGLALTLICSYWLPIEILLQGQPWRVFWLALPIASMAALDVLSQTWRNQPIARPLIVGAGSLIASTPSLLPTLALLGLVLCLSPVLAHHLTQVISGYRRQLYAATALITLLCIPEIISNLELAGHQLINPWWSGTEWLQGLLTGGIWPLALVGFLFRDHKSRAISCTLSATLILPLILVANSWDRRLPERKAEQACFLNTDCASHPFLQTLTPGDTIYWSGQEARVWFLLRTPSYYGRLQGIGAVFSEKKLHEWRRREAFVHTAVTPASLCADSEIDWIVVGHLLPNIVPDVTANSDYLYSCARLSHPTHSPVDGTRS